MNRAEYINATVANALQNHTISHEDAARILLRVATISKGYEVDDNFPEMVELYLYVMNQYGQQSPFFVVCLEIDDSREGSELEYVLATRRQFSNEADARAYANTVAPTREPLVLRVVPK